MVLAKEPVSHVGLEFAATTFSLAMDCTKPYGKVYHIKDWLKKYDLVFSMELPLSEEEELEVYKIAAQKSIRVPYDWGAYYYGFIALIKQFFLGTPLPKENIWQHPDTRICTEILEPLKDVLYRHNIDIRDLDLTAVTPMGAARVLLERTEGHKEVYWHGFLYKAHRPRGRFGVFPFTLLRRDKL